MWTAPPAKSGASRVGGAAPLASEVYSSAASYRPPCSSHVGALRIVIVASVLGLLPGVFGRAAGPSSARMRPGSMGYWAQRRQLVAGTTAGRAVMLSVSRGARGVRRRDLAGAGCQGQ